ncbi:hypothetical protein GF391_00050 [Candidatus Uhrbacteria bacterium]|nr:hypothetical protein [Candidatus Uhrbacteria bacterium]
MVSDKYSLIICHTHGRPLGEVVFDHDLFKRAVLYPEGEELIGNWLADWQVRGLLYSHPEIDDKSKLNTISEHVSIHSPVFPCALRQWLEMRGYYSILLPEASWEMWNKIQELPLLPNERFCLALRLSAADPAQHVKNTASMQRALNEIHTDSKKTRPSQTNKNKNNPRTVTKK